MYHFRGTEGSSAAFLSVYCSSKTIWRFHNSQRVSEIGIKTEWNMHFLIPLLTLLVFLWKVLIFFTSKIAFCSLHAWLLKLAIFSVQCSAPQTHINTYIFFSHFVALEFRESRKAISTPFRKQSPVLFKLWVTVSLYFGCLVKSSRVSTADCTSYQCLAINY